MRPEFPFNKYKGFSEYMEEYNNNPPPSHDRNIPIVNITLSSRMGPLGGTERSLVLPEEPNMAQLITAYSLLKTHFVFSARRENQYIGYAFNVNASSVFSWRESSQK